MVAQNGKPIYRKAFGKANLELDVNLTPENGFQLGFPGKTIHCRSGAHAGATREN